MSPDERDEPFLDDDEEEPRSLISSLWFRLALVVAAVGVIGVIVVPRALDWINPASTIGSMKPVAAVAPPTAPAAPSDRNVVNLSPPAPAGGSPSAPAPGSGPSASTPPSSTSAEPSATSPVATAAPAVAKVEEPKPATAMPATPSGTPAPGAAATAPATPSRAAVAPRDPEPKPKPSARSAGSGDYWVQVAAFHEPKGAARLATQLRGQNFSVTETTATLPAAGKSAAAPATAPAKAASRYDVLVTGASAAEITPKLTSGDLSAEAMGNDVIVKPSLPLAAATNLSKSLAAAGYKVQVRRAPGGETEQAAGRTGDAAGTKAAGSDAASPVYRVRVGPFPDRATAAATLQELEAKGYKPFIAKGQP